MWMCPTSPVQVSLMMVVVLIISNWSPVILSSGISEGGSDTIKSFSKRAKSLSAMGIVKIEIVAILADASNASLALSKALVRALNSPAQLSDVQIDSSSETRNFTFRVKNFVIANFSGSAHLMVPGGGEEAVHDDDDDNDVYESRNQRKGFKKHHLSSKSPLNITFSPNLVVNLCEFLERTKAVAMVNLISDAASERLLSLVSSAATLPLLGYSQFSDPLQTLLKSKDDFYINLSISVRHFARALGHLLIYCHWHTFTVLFDDSPSILSSQMVWEEELSSMQATYRFYHKSPINSTTSDFYDDYEHQKYVNTNVDYETEGGNDDDLETSPVLNPNYITLMTKNSNAAFRALSGIMKATQGVVVLLCSEKTLLHVFSAAQKLGMLNGDYVFILVGQRSQFEVIPEWVPSGVLALRSPQNSQIGKQTMKRAGKLLSSAFHSVKNLKICGRGIQQQPSPESGRSSSSNFITSIKSSTNGGVRSPQNTPLTNPNLYIPKEKSKSKTHDLLTALPYVSCWKIPPSFSKKCISQALTREIHREMEVTQSSIPPRDKPGKKDSGELSRTFEILNLMRSESKRIWHKVGNVCVETTSVQLETIRWPSGGIFGPQVRDRATKAYRVVTITSPPFVMIAEADDNKTCVKGLPCLKVETVDKDELALIFADFDRGKYNGPSYRLACCDGLAMDLLSSISRELKFEIDLFLVPDGYFGSRSSAGHWNGMMSALLSGAAHLSFAPISVTSIRANVVDFSTPFFFSGVSLLGMSKSQNVSLMAFLAPFSFELWAAIFITLNMTALAVALFEWLSPFGLNPWGRQRTKNFSMASALWVVWGRLFSHLVAFKAPKSWPNKFLINVWGGFSVIFVASYTANIAALFAGRFFEQPLGVHDRSLLSQRVAAVKHSATDFYIKREHLQLWEHIQKFPVFSFQQGIELLKNGSLDLLIGDGPLLDYYRGTDSSCHLIDVSDHDKIGDDTYAVAMTKGFPLKESISSLVAKYIGNGYMDYLQGKWYGQLACFRRRRSELVGARALGVDAVAGMMIMLGVGTLVGLLILLMELIVYKYALPYFRKQPKGTLWRSPNIMFFSQKLYRFINCVELVSPHHAAKELVNTLRHGQITSLFQKSVKRKEHEQRRRRKSKAQFFEMIQEVRRVQKRERQESVPQHVEGSHENESGLVSPIYSIQTRLESNKQTPKLIRVLGVDVDRPNKTFLTMPSRSSGSGAGHGTTGGGVAEIFEEEIDTGPLNPLDYTDNDNKQSQSRPPTSKGRRKPTTKILKRKDGGSGGVGYSHKGKSVEFDLGHGPGSMDVGDDEEEIEVETRFDYSPETNGDERKESECFSSESSRLDQGNLSGLSKSQIIRLWRESESNLRRQLADTLREREELTLKLDALSSEKPP